MRRSWTGRLLRTAIALVAQLALGLGLWRGGVELAERPTQVDGYVRDARFLRGHVASGAAVALYALVSRPSGPGPYPVALLSPGSPGDRDEDARRQLLLSTTTELSQVAMAFARRGYAAVVVLRRGHGLSSSLDSFKADFATEYDKVSGLTADGTPECQGLGARLLEKLNVEDVKLAMDALRGEPWADTDRTVLVGTSAGGFASLQFAATRPPGVRGVLAFASGVRYRCPERDLCAEAMSSFGARVRVPVQFVFSANDTFFGPELLRHWAGAFVEGGGNAEVVETPAIQSLVAVDQTHGARSSIEGHFVLQSSAQPGTAGTEPLWPHVDSFLERVGLPGQSQERAASALQPPLGLDEHGTDAFRAYAASEEYEKAFAVGPHGAWGQSVRDPLRKSSIDNAIRRCNDGRPRGCWLYAVGDRRVPRHTPVWLAALLGAFPQR